MTGSTPNPPRRLLVIANPISGGGRSRVLVPALCEALARHSVAATPYFTTAAGDAAARARSAGDEAWDGLIACGGDGTVNEVLNGMPDPTRPLGVFPVGTANVLSLELGLSNHPERAAAQFASGLRRQVAIGCCGERRFLLFCGAGLDGAVVQRLSEVRTGTLGKHKWAGPILHTVRHWPHFSLRATFADGSSLDGLSSVLVTRVKNFGGVVHLTPDVRIDDGLLHVLCFRMRSRTAWLWQGLRGMVHRMRAGRHLTVRTTTSVRIDGDAPFQIDGDFAGRTPVHVTLLSERAQLMAPA